MEPQITVLVVDDDQSMVKTICDILRIKGYDAKPACCGEEAVEKVKGDGPDCVLMDLRMPGIDGIETLKRIKEIKRDLPVVLMSAYATGEQADEARRHGVHAVLAKPIDIPAVLLLLSRLGNDELKP